MATLWDALKQASARTWKDTGGNRLVKVMCDWSLDQTMARAGPDGAGVGGCVTQAKYLYGLTAPQIEQALGLRPFELRDIAFVHALEETPGPGGFEFKLTASFPDGKVFEDLTTGLMDAMHEAIDKFRLGIGVLDRSWHPVIQFFPPGSRMVPQWRLTDPVALGPRLGIASRKTPFLRENGSSRPYRRHARKVVV